MSYLIKTCLLPGQIIRQSAGLPSGRSWVQTPTRPAIRVFNKKTGEIMLPVIQELDSVKMITSFSGDIKPLVLSPLSFHKSNPNGRKRTHTTVQKEQGKFLWWCVLPFMHHKSFISWVMGGLQKAHKWTDSGCQWHPCLLRSVLTVDMFNT